MGLRIHHWLLAAALGLVGSGCTRMASLSVIQAAPELKLPNVRVLLGDEYDSVTVSSARTYRVDAVRAHDDTVTFYSISPMVIRPTMTGLMLVDRGWYIIETNVQSIRVSPQEQGGYARVNGSAYRGEIVVRMNADGRLAAVNRVGMEPYLFGVVPKEIGFYGPDIVQAMKAQAVAARTYAFSHLGQYGNKDFDLRADVMDQVYGGVDAERPLVTIAVWDTRGEVLRYNGGYVKSYYHSTCGGHTEAIEDVWERPAEPYLKSVDDDEFCAWSSYWEWTENCTRAWLDSNVFAFVEKEKLGNRKLLGELLSMRIVARRATGRVEEMQLIFEHGLIPLAGDRSRWAIGRPSRNSAILPSANYSLRFDRPGSDWTRVIVKGRGYGHGVGMCQCGAIGRARAGQKHDEILRAYYKSARLEKVY